MIDYKPVSTIPDPEITGGLRRSASQSRLVRSNSMDNLNKPLAHASRKRGREEDTVLTSDAMKDFSVVAVYSREAFENFGRTWKSRMKSDSLARATKQSKIGVSTDDMSDRLGRLSSKEVTTGFKDQVQALLENRTVPHVIAVIEGKQEQDAFSLKTRVGDKPVDLGYTRVQFSQGFNAKGSTDDKQSMNMYVRDDMKAVYHFSDETVAHGTDEIQAIGVNYATTDGTRYQSLVVHIPNRFVGTSEKEAATHQAFEDYAANAAAQEHPVVVTGYLGDTNFKKPFYENSVPSMGGILPNGGTLNPQSSGAQNETHFMQFVGLGEPQGGHAVMQSATTNSVFLTPDANNREAIDHPSTINVTGHPFDLAGRDWKAIPDFYPEI